MPDGVHNALMDFLPVRLAEANDEDAMVRSLAVLGKALVGGDEYPLLCYRDVPKVFVGQSLRRRSANVLHVVAEFSQAFNTHAGDILVDEDSHSSEAGDLDWRYLLFGERGCVVEAGHDVFTG